MSSDPLDQPGRMTAAAQTAALLRELSVGHGAIQT